MGEPSCVDDDTALAYATGTLDATARAGVEAHLDTCVPCRRLVSALARAESPATEETDPDERRLAQTERIGRFVVLGLVGVGGMGAVYAAYDPELDRKVAIKLLHPPRNGEASLPEVDLRVEGKAMARVTHPNVVAVHDVGLNGGAPFIAMEFVEGRSLRRWLEESKRTPEQILGVFVEAGRGLAAAHAAGLVHRDFKPENVLITKDGRAKVTDFGLARSTHGDAAGGVEISGTPAYMSPEQRAGEVLDARSDVYSFAVSLVEALSGARPLEPVSASGLLRLPSTAGEIAAPIRRAVARALASERGARFESIDGLLEELVDAPRRRRRRAIGAVAFVATIGLAGGAVQRARVERARLCASAADETVAVWDDAKRDSVRARFEATGRAFARQAWAPLDRAVGAFAQELATEERAACEATRVRHEQSEETLALRSACLERRRVELQAMTEVLADADETVIENSVAAVGKLTPVEACRSTGALAMQPLPPPDAATGTAVEQLRQRLATVKALLDAGQYRGGIEAADSCVKDAEALAYAPVRAEALFMQGAIRDELSDATGAEDALTRAAEDAEQSRHDEVAAKARTLLVWVTGYRRARHDAGHALESAARGAIRRAGGRADLEAPLENNLGTLLWAEGKYALAEARFDRARTLSERAYGASHPLVADALNNRGLALWNEGKLEAALALHEEALAMRTRLLGGEHPAVASSLNNRGLVSQDLGRYERAREDHLRAVEIQTQGHGSKHPLVASALNNLGLAELGLGQNEAALGALRRAYEVRTATRPDTHPEIANSLVNLAIAYDALGERSRARECIDEAHARQLRVLGPAHPALVDTLIVDARLLRAEKKNAEAAARGREAWALARGLLGATHPLCAAAAVEEGVALVALGRFDEAMGRLEPVVAQERVLTDSLVVGTAAVALAEACLGAKTRSSEVGDWLELGRRRLRGAGARARPMLARAERITGGR